MINISSFLNLYIKFKCLSLNIKFNDTKRNIKRERKMIDIIKIKYRLVKKKIIFNNNFRLSDMNNKITFKLIIMNTEQRNS